MVIKSLTITEDAYDALKGMKYDNESFSDVILRIKKKQVILVEECFGVMKMSDKELKETLDNLKRIREETGRGFEERAEKLKMIGKKHGNC